jgi:hypothetical protein
VARTEPTGPITGVSTRTRSEVEPGAGSLGRLAWWCIGGSVGLFALVGGLGDSAATPGLGPRTLTPPWDLAARPPAALVTVALAAAIGLGAFAVLIGLRAVAAGWRPGARTVAAAGVVAVAVLVLVPPTGSGDHLSYLAYGRIAATGGDPYLVSPRDWHGGTDPVAGAVQPPWQDTPSVYGPVATAAQALVALGGGDSLRLTVWLWQLLCGAAFGLTAFVLDRLAGADRTARARVAVLWLLNPILLGELVLGAHLDVLAAAAGVGVLAVAARRPLLAGALLGAAVGIKAPYALFGLAALWAVVRGLPRARAVRHVVSAAVAALAVLVPAHVWAGPHVFDQLGRASGFTTLSSPWRSVANLGDLLLGHGSLRPVITPIALILAAGFAVPLARRVARLTSAPADPLTADAARAALVLTAAWALTAPYALPWYDAMVWAPLALLGASAFDRLLLVRLAVLSLAYIPGRVVEVTRGVYTVTLGWRLAVAPVVVVLVIVGVLRWTGDRTPFGPDRPVTGRPEGAA